MSIFLGKIIENNEGKQFYIYRTTYFPYTEGCPDYGHHQYKYINYYVDETGTFGRRAFILSIYGEVKYLLPEKYRYMFAKKQNCKLKRWLKYYFNTSPPRTGPKSETLTRGSKWYEWAYLYNYLNKFPDPFQSSKKRKRSSAKTQVPRKKRNNNNTFRF